jgi:hypothetical protein
VTLDNFERIALSVPRGNRFESISDEEYLARAVLAMLPTVRAAEALIDDYRSETPDGGATTYALCKAVDAMRAAIGEKL